MNINKMMKDLQKMQSKLHEEIDQLEVESSAGGGMVTARMSGKKELLSIKLSPEVITPDDPELLEDLIIATTRSGHGQSPRLAQADAMPEAAAL